MKTTNAEILHEHGPYPGAQRIHGVTYDGKKIWLATGEQLLAVDPETGERVDALEVRGDAGTAFDGTHLYQLADGKIHKVDPSTGRILRSMPAPVGGGSGLAWAEGALWMGRHRDRKILELDPETGAVLRTLHSNRFVTGVSWLGDELWHGTWEGDESELRRIDPQTGTVEERVVLPAGVNVSGLESDGRDRFFCGGGGTGKLRVVRRPRR